MATAEVISDRLPRGVTRHSKRHARRAAVTVTAVMFVVLAVFVAIVVVNSAYLTAVNRGMEDVSSIMALGGAPDLLDPNLLLDAAGPPQPNQTASRITAIASADNYRQRNNAVLPTLERLDATDVVIQTGFVCDVTAHPPLLDTSAVEHNTVYVYSARTTSGSHSVTYSVDLSGGTRSLEIRGGAYATLDNLVAGFRAEPLMAAPLMPLGILSNSWSSERTEDTNSDGINEMVVRLQSANPPSASQYPPQPNAALLCYSGSLNSQILSQTLPQQITRGLYPPDLPPLGTFGPATPTLLASVVATQMGDGGDAGTAAILAALTPIIGQKRAFPLIQQMANVGSDGSGLAQVEGFVACTILAAAITDNRLTVRVEPCYLIHHTAWTAPPAALETPTGLYRNLYIYKLRLCR